MFSWSKKKDSKRRGRPESDSEENEFGIKLDKGPDDKQLEAELKRLAGIDSLPDDLNVNESDDVELELLKLIGGGGKGKQPVKKTASPDEPIGDISKLTAEIDLGDEEIDVDENDPELLGELLELTNPDEEIFVDEAESDSESERQTSDGDSDVMATLKERLKLYKTAETKAKENNESSRARRFARGIKTLEDLLKRAKAGKPVPPDEIPPVIAVNLKPAPPPPPPSEATEDIVASQDGPENLSDKLDNVENVQDYNAVSEPGDVLKTLTERLKMYEFAEKKAKESGETTRARRFNRGIKTLQGLIKQAQAGKPVAPGDIPPEVALNLKPVPPFSPQPPPPADDVPDNYEENVENEMESISLTGPPDEAESREPQEQEKNIMDVLSERLLAYKTAEAKAKESGESSRARRFGRGIKTLQDLIAQATAGKPIAADDIPPVVALNLKPAPVFAPGEEEPREGAADRSDPARSSDAPEKPLSFAAVDDAEVDVDELEEETPATVLEGLEQRVRLYTKFQEKAKEEGNVASADQNERIARVYSKAIETFKSGGFVDVEKLPNPRGCPPIPIPFFVE